MDRPNFSKFLQGMVASADFYQGLLEQHSVCVSEVKTHLGMIQVRLDDGSGFDLIVCPRRGEEVAVKGGL